MPAYVSEDAIQLQRYKTAVSVMSSLRQFFEGKYVLDFGASNGLSMSALLECGAASVVGVEPDLARVRRGKPTFGDSLLHVADTRRLPFSSDMFDVVLCNAVLEHIPQPRTEYFIEIWRVLKRKGFLIVNETPNKYIPVDYHTTHLAFVNWMPKALARGYSIARGRWDAEKDWEHSGWRGIGQRELFSNLPGHRDVSPKTRFRHRIFGQALDPYPTWVIQKAL
jgi:ubiquinone/menaquinone biosynthesis C-methylase UbiE